MSENSSFRKIDYTLRPAKNIERKMMAELFGRVILSQPNETYAYIGFGSVYFTDFALFHRTLGLAPMYSIEGDDEGKRRAPFNVPFSCVKIHEGRSEVHLPTVSFDQPTIVWLDYDTELYANAISDIATVVSRQCAAGFSGTFVGISVDAGSKRLSKPKSVSEEELEDWPDDPVEQFRRLVGESNFPPNTQAADLRGLALGETYRRIVNDRIVPTLSAIGGWGYSQLLNFRYADGAEMATYGGIVYRQEDEDMISRRGFDSLAFVRRAGEDYRISTPRLTFREIQALGREVHGDAVPSGIPIDPDEFAKFREVYRYFPSFIEAEL